MKIECIKGVSDRLTKGKVYDVTGIWELYGNSYKYTVFNDLGREESFVFDIFKEVHECKSQPWTKEVVFKTYCNDNLYELPLRILEQMRDYVENIIDNKKEESK